jgi:GntR family transcriptional repressor for pyruvate dehydrogenase complex
MQASHLRYAPIPLDMRYSSQTNAVRAADDGASSAEGKAVYKLVRTSRLYEQIVEQIEGSIVKGDLKAGDQLPAERDLAQRFGVSRTAVREAVKALREKGLVEAYSGRGTFITDGTTQAAVRIQEPELTTMRDAVAAMDRAGQDPETYIEADLDFHLALAEGAANPLILSLLDSIVALLREQRLRIFKVPGGPERGQIHHKRILDAVDRHDSEKAREAMRAHLWQVRDDSQVPAAKRNSGKPGMR